jgi:hypothetical protein
MPTDTWRAAVDTLVARGVVTVEEGGVVRLTQRATNSMLCVRCVHFVGFKDDRWWSAVKTWGRPDFVHRFWDRRAVDEVMEGDVVVFATGDETQPVNPFAYDDSAHF